MTASTSAKPTVRHEEFCPVVDKGAAPRLESYPYLAEDAVTGRSRPTHQIERCRDCGAAHYTARS